MKNKYAIILLVLCILGFFLVDSASAGKWRSRIACVVAVKTVKKQAVPPLPRRVGVVSRSTTPTRFYTCTNNRCYYRTVRRIRW